MCSYVSPKMFYHLPYIPNMFWPLKGLYQEVKTFIKRRMQSVIKLCPYSGKFNETVHVRYVKTQPEICWLWLGLKYLKFINIHVFTNKVNVTQVVHTH